jgi:hypothetical protein
MTTETPPDWVLLEAAKRTNTNLSVDRLRASYHRLNSFTALCDMIQKHEKPPADRKLLCAREAEAGMILYGNLSYTEITENRENIARVCIRAIELYEEGFGK